VLGLSKRARLGRIAVTVFLFKGGEAVGHISYAHGEGVKAANLKGWGEMEDLEHYQGRIRNPEEGGRGGKSLNQQANNLEGIL